MRMRDGWMRRQQRTQAGGRALVVVCVCVLCEILVAARSVLHLCYPSPSPSPYPKTLKP